MWVPTGEFSTYVRRPVEWRGTGTIQILLASIQTQLTETEGFTAVSTDVVSDA